MPLLSVLGTPGTIDMMLTGLPFAPALEFGRTARYSRDQALTNEELRRELGQPGSELVLTLLLIGSIECLAISMRVPETDRIAEIRAVQQSLHLDLFEPLDWDRADRLAGQTARLVTGILDYQPLEISQSFLAVA